MPSHIQKSAEPHNARSVQQKEEFYLVFIAFSLMLLEHDDVHSKSADLHTSSNASAARNFLSKHLRVEMGKIYLFFLSYYPRLHFS